MVLVSMTGLCTAQDQAPAENVVTKLDENTYLVKNATIQVAVTLKDKLISQIKIMGPEGNTCSYCDKVQPMIDAIITEQTTDVDGVSGATISCEAIKSAVDLVLKKVRDEQEP